MPPRTRSCTIKASAIASAESKKRKASSPGKTGNNQAEKQLLKRPRTLPSKDTENNKNTLAASYQDGPIIINRAPVLELWGACVAHVTKPELSWPLCLAIGSSIATILAISKWRAIGTVAQPDEVTKSKKSTRKEDDDTSNIEVMGFSMTLKGNAVVVKGKKKTASEENLRAKFGQEAYERVKKTMEESLSAWQDNEDDLNGKAFHMYEKFRPDVAKGQKGWGRKGELYLPKVEEAVRK